MDYPTQVTPGLYDPRHLYLQQQQQQHQQQQQPQPSLASFSASLPPVPGLYDPSAYQNQNQNQTFSRAESFEEDEPLKPVSSSKNSKFGVACLKCRARKIKCDGNKPNCENCTKKGFQCLFDDVPRTRGPDKKPGRKRRTAAQKAADLKLEEEMKAKGVLPVKSKRKRPSTTAPAATMEVKQEHASPDESSQPLQEYEAGPSSSQPPLQDRNDAVAPVAYAGYSVAGWPVPGAPSGPSDAYYRPPPPPEQLASPSQHAGSYARYAPVQHQEQAGYPMHPSPHLSNNGHHPIYAQHPQYLPLQHLASPVHSSYPQSAIAYSDAQHTALPSPHLLHTPYPPPSPLAPLQDPRSSVPFQTPSHVDLPVPNTSYTPPLVISNGSDPQAPSSNRPSQLPGTRCVNIVNSPRVPPFYAPPDANVSYYQHPYGQPKEEHPLLDHVIAHGFMPPDTAGNVRASLTGPGPAVNEEAEERKKEGGSGGQVGLLSRPGSGQGQRLMLNDLLQPQGQSYHGASIPPSQPHQQYRTYAFPQFGQQPSAPTRPLAIPKQPTSDYPQRIWWDCLLSQYGTTRSEAYKQIISDIGHLFRVSNHWTAFFHIPRFIAILHQPERRERLQPALVYAVLAMSTQLSSWDGPGGKGMAGRLLGLKLNEQAHACFWSSWNSGWIDADLAKAAYLMAMYEISCHPIHSDARSAQAMTLLDNVLRTLQLCSLDADNPRVSTYAPGEVPCIPEGSAKVPCTVYPEKVLDAEMNTTNCPFWAACPRWSTPTFTPTDAEIVRDESRRLVWASCALAASISMYTHNVWRQRADDWYVSNCENFALLFPGEMLFDPAHSKSNVWALYYTTALLWNFAIRSHYDSASTAELKRKKAFEVWATTTRIENYFQPSTTPTSTDDRTVPWPEQISKLAFGWQSRDWLVTARFLVADSIKTLGSLNVGETASMIHSATAREWLTNQSAVAKSLQPSTDSFGKYSTALVNHRPILLWWLLQQLARILDLFDSDPTFTTTLDVARLDFCPIIEVFAQLYPSVGLYEVVVHRVISRLNEASAMASGAFQQAFPESNPLLPRFPPFYLSLNPATLVPHDRILEMIARDPLPVPDGLGFDDSPPYQFNKHLGSQGRGTVVYQG